MIEINNLTTRVPSSGGGNEALRRDKVSSFAVQIDKEFLKKICQEVLGEKNIELSIVLVGEARMRELNKKYRRKNKVTDVLSFQYASERSERSGEKRQSLFKDVSAEGVQGQKEHKAFFKDACAGEIVICLREIKKNAKKTNITSEEGLTRVLIHGILHLLGYNHEKSKIEAEKMREKEEYYFRKITNYK